MESRRALVTGATGFVGRALTAELRGRSTFVRGVARRAVETSPANELIAADLTGLPADHTLAADIDTIYHLAAKTHDMAGAPEAEYWRANVEGTERLLAGATNGRVRRVVFVSSVKAMDEGRPFDVDEEMMPEPSTPYGRSKLAAERLVMQAAAQHGFEAVCLRFPLIYGPGQRGNLERMIDAVRAGRFPPPPANGNRRSMLHVGNAVQALVLAGTHPEAAGRTYIVTDARPYSTRELYDAIRAGLGKGPSSWSLPMPVFRLLAAGGDVVGRLAGRRVGFDSDALQKLLGSASYSPARITRELGYAPSHDLITSMPALIAGARREPDRQ